MLRRERLTGQRTSFYTPPPPPASRRRRPIPQTEIVPLKPDSNIEEALEHFALAHEAEAEERAEQLDDLRFRALQQWPEKLKVMRESDINGARPCLVLDQVGQRCRRVANDVRQNMPSIRVRPVDDRADKDTANVINGLIRHVEDVSSASQAYLTALSWAVDVGLGYYRILTELADDSWDQQQIRIQRIHNRFAVYRDPHSTALDGSDMEWCFITDKVPRKALEKSHPNAEMPADFPSGSEGDLQRDWFGEDHVRIAEYFKIAREKDELVRLEDLSIMYGSRYQKLRSNGEVLLPVIDSRPVDRRVCEWQKMSGAQVLDKTHFPSSYIPVIPVIGTEFWIDGKRELSGLVRPCKDPQRGLNYHASVATEVMALQPRAPYIGAAGQFENHPEWDNANSENYSKLEYEPVTFGGVAVGAPQRQQMSGAPSGMLQMMQMFSEQISQASGMHEASIGAPSNETSRVAIKERRDIGEVGTAHYRGNMGFSMLHGARILLEMFPVVMDTAQIARIIGEDGAIDTVSLEPGLGVPSQITPKGQPNRHDITVGKYDLSIDIGPAFATRRQDAAAAMIEMASVDQALMATAADLVYRQMDWPGAEQIADRRKKGIPPEFQDDQEGGEPQIPPQVKAQIDQAMQQYDEQIAQAQQMIEGLQQQLSEASQAAQEGQAAANDKQADHAIKSQELEIKRFEAQTKRAEAQARLDAAKDAASEQGRAAVNDEQAPEMELRAFEAETKRMDLQNKRMEIQIKAREVTARTDQITAETEQTQGANEVIAGLLQAQQGIEVVLGEVVQATQAMRAPKRIEVIRGLDGRLEGARIECDEPNGQDARLL